MPELDVGHPRSLPGPAVLAATEVPAGVAARLQSVGIDVNNAVVRKTLTAHGSCSRPEAYHQPPRSLMSLDIPVLKEMYRLGVPLRDPQVMQTVAALNEQLIVALIAAVKSPSASGPGIASTDHNPYAVHNSQNTPAHAGAGSPPATHVEPAGAAGTRQTMRPPAAPNALKHPAFSPPKPVPPLVSPDLSQKDQLLRR